MAYFTVNKTKIFYKKVGQGEPLLIVHGFAIDHRALFSTVEQSLSDNPNHYERIYIDLPGMGKSEADKQDIKNADDLLSLLIHFIDEIIGKRSFSLFGYSYGGYLALGLLNKRSDSINKFILLAPVIVADTKKRTLPQRSVLLYEKFSFSDTDKESFSDYKGQAVQITESGFQRYLSEIASGLKIGNKQFLKDFQRTGYTFSFENDLLPEIITQPALFLLGKQDDVVGYQDIYSKKHHFENGKFVLLKNAGHNLQLEEHEKIQKELTNFLA